MTEIILTSGTKRCGRCKKVKPRLHFRAGGKASYCKHCHNEYQKRWAATPQQRPKETARKRAWRTRQDEEWQEARRAYNRQWSKANPEKEAEKSRNFRRRHPERIAAYGKAYRETHRKERCFLQQTREARKKRACPLWVDLTEIKSIYAACPPDHHVDHIIPLKTMDGRKHIASGLHVPWNLQYLPASENHRKWTKLPEEYS